MRVAFFSTHSYDREFFDAANASGEHELVYLEPKLNAASAVCAESFPAVCLFVNDRADAETIERLAQGGTRLIVLRCAGFNNVDLRAAKAANVAVARVPAYSPHAVAEHALALILTLNRKICRAYTRVRDGNFALDGLLGFDIHGRTAGVVGTGRIGQEMARILNGLGCTILAHDIQPNPEVTKLGVRYTALETLLAESDIVTLHCPLTPQTMHMFDAAALARMKRGAMLVNTSRGALIDTAAAIQALKGAHLGGLGLDVYEEEEHLFFADRSNEILQDDIFARLLTFPNVVITGHQAFFTREALENIARTTLDNIGAFAAGRELRNKVEAGG